MREERLRDVLLVRAFEEGDEEGKLLGLRERAIVTREVRDEFAVGGVEPDPEALLARRAERLRERILRNRPTVQRVFDLSARRGLPWWIALGGGALVGGAIDHIGSAQTINLLNFPILGLLAYNLAIYLAILLSSFRPRHRQTRYEGRASRAAAQGILARFLLWLASPERFWRRSPQGDGRATVCAQRYTRDWLRVGAPLHVARGARWMHFAAAGLMLGAICGLYLRGLVLDYDASWESTFLTPGAVHAALEFVFAPAVWILGEGVPPVGEIEAMRAPDGKPGEAAFWIHFYGVTAGLFVVLPRLVLALMAAHRARARAADIPLPLEGDAYFLKLLARERGQGRWVVVQPYSYHPSSRSTEGLKTLMLDLFGGRIRVASLEPAAYGDDPLPDPADAESGNVCRLTLFTLAQSPEQEVHGRFLQELRDSARDERGIRSLLVIVDRGPYAERLGRADEAAERLEERERNWQRLMRELGLTAVVCDLGGPTDADLLESAREAQWPAPLNGGDL